ncbi:MAG: aldehyde dehydrogenase (NADP(+)), partial [Anditalea sp.]
NKAVIKAEQAFRLYRKIDAEKKACFLEQIAEEIIKSNDLIQRCSEETGLPEARLMGERARTISQLKLFASLVREGSWVNASIDTAISDRTPLPKPDLRQMQIALGPVGIFGASNFPFAFSVAGGDTASALAAGCTVVVKGHPAHPGTSELTASAILKAAHATGMPDGVFSLVQGAGTEVGMAIVTHPLIKAIGFTGSFRGGKALYDAAAQRREPIPVYAEMGSINPVFILPEALKTRGGEIAFNLTESITLGAGQFCTNPGLVVVEETSEGYLLFQEKTNEKLSNTTASAMLTPGIKQAYDNGTQNFLKIEGVSELARGRGGDIMNSGIPQILTTTAAIYLDHKELSEEVFGPSSLFVKAKDKDEITKLAENLDGHLTATIHGTEDDLKVYADLIHILERKVGRIIINGFPTGVEVCPSMIHGGPYPATTDSRTTSVGTLAIYRFTRPVCYQGFSDVMLPSELKNSNPLSIFRLVNGKLSQDQI